MELVSALAPLTHRDTTECDRSLTPGGPRPERPGNPSPAVFARVLMD